MTEKALRPLAEANRITKMLDHVLGEDRFDRSPVDIKEVALGYSARNSGEEPIAKIEAHNLGVGCAGMLVPSDTVPRRWAIAYDRQQSEGRRNFTIGHEFGHYVLHRHLLGDNGIRCGEKEILYRAGEGIEKEADEFAAAILMPLNDFRRQISPNEMPSFDELGAMANRYGVSLTAVALRWLEYTERRSILVVSNEGFAHWARSSKSAFKAGRFIRTKNDVFELPDTATAVTGEYTDETKRGLWRNPGVWFAEPVFEMCMRSARYDVEFTLLHFEPTTSDIDHGEEPVEDLFDAIAVSAR
jgi:hypothetical protein